MSRVWIMQPPGAGWFLLCEGEPLNFKVLAQGSKKTLALNPKFALVEKPKPQLEFDL